MVFRIVCTCALCVMYLFYSLRVLNAYINILQKYGDTLLKNGAQPRKVTVFLNPAAKRG